VKIIIIIIKIKNNNNAIYNASYNMAIVITGAPYNVSYSYFAK